MIVLVSLSRVLADVEREFYRRWEYMYRGRPRVRPEQRQSPNLTDDYPGMYRQDVESILYGMGFFRGLPPVAGAIEALHELAAHDLKVRICTSTTPGSLFSAQEKLAWVREHMGEDWANKMILAPDKTMVQGDVLITAAEPSAGAVEPTWQPIIFDQPFNQDASGPRLYGWSNWDAVMATVTEAHPACT